MLYKKGPAGSFHFVNGRRCLCPCHDHLWGYALHSLLLYSFNSYLCSDLLPRSSPLLFLNPPQLGALQGVADQAWQSQTPPRLLSLLLHHQLNRAHWWKLRSFVAAKVPPRL